MELITVMKLAMKVSTFIAFFQSIEKVTRSVTEDDNRQARRKIANETSQSSERHR